MVWKLHRKYTCSAQRAKAFKATNLERLPGEASRGSDSCPPALPGPQMSPAASSSKKLLCARPCRNMASLILTSPDEALTIIQVGHLKLKKFTHSSVAGSSPRSGPPLPPCTAWPRPGKTFVRPLASGESIHVPCTQRTTAELLGEENRGSMDSVPVTTAEGVGRTRGEEASSPLPHSSQPPFRPSKLREHGEERRMGNRKRGRRTQANWLL